MPELPQIQPSGGGIQPGGVVRSQPNPLGSQIAQQAEKFQDQAIEMGMQAQRMNRYINFHQADADFITRSADIDQATRSIPDPTVGHTTRVRLYGELKDELQQKYSAAGPELGPQLQVRMAENVRNSYLKAQAENVENSRYNLESMAQSSIMAATAAPTTADMNTV